MTLLETVVVVFFGSWFLGILVMAVQELWEREQHLA